ncbi:MULTISPECIES: substrate-binding domain-containing protein [unclassified Streptomyces]|uniref:substrate-binding domain-containing protein n=1 Tax=unclassified Streptomyces TaxID=2593676 RepID=UPI003814923A
MDRFDPRGRVNRALLVGVEEYEHTQPDDPEGVPGQLPAVRHNLRRLEGVLRRGGIFGAHGTRNGDGGQEDGGGRDGITVLRSPSLDQFSEALRTAAQDAEGLLLCYFAGHGAVPSAGNELFLQMRNARVVAGGRAVFPGADAFTGVLTVLAGSQAERIVVILDCCYAGNAAKVWHDFADRRHRILLLMSVQANRLIDSGDGTRATPFTEELVQLLDIDEELSFVELSDQLRGQMAEAGRRTPLGDLWEPQSAAEPGTDVLLTARGDGRKGEQEDGAVAGQKGRREQEDQPGRPTPPASVPAQSSEEPGPSAQFSEQPPGAEPPGAEPPGAEPPGGRPGSEPEVGTGSPVRFLAALLAALRTRARAVIEWFLGLRTRARILVSALLALALAALGAGGYELLGPGVDSCALPLEIRLLTDPDLEPTVRAAADAYLTSRANTTGPGCRRSGITVYSAGAAAAVSALRRQSDAWQEPRAEDTNPQRDVGPQPDVWIPASGTETARVTADWTTRSYLELKPDEKPFVYSPVVLAVPQNVAGQKLDEIVGLPLSRLIEKLKANEQKAVVLRPDPEITDSALLATIGLYGSTTDSREAERPVRSAGPPSPTAAALLCALPASHDADVRTAALVPEFLLRSGVGCASTTRVARSAEYPVDVPALTPTFVRVRWEGGDRDAAARDDAVGRFRNWLTGEEGLKVFATAGFRSATEPGHPLLDTHHVGVGVLRNPRPLPGAARGTAMEEALTGYRSAHGPGRVLYLLDSSASMSTQWPGPSGAPGILKQSLRGLGDRDEYEVWAVHDTSGGRTHRVLLPYGPHPRAEAERVIDEAQWHYAQADPYKSLLDALKSMQNRGTDDQRPWLIVYITDGEYKDRLAGKNLEVLLDRARQKPQVPVDMVSLNSGSCVADRPGARIAEASGGRCLDAGDDPGRSLRDEVARVGTGEH